MLICVYSHDYFVLFEANYNFDKVSHDSWVILVIFLAALKQYLPNSRGYLKKTLPKKLYKLNNMTVNLNRTIHMIK